MENIDKYVSAAAAIFSAIAAIAVLFISWRRHIWNKRFNKALVTPALSLEVDFNESTLEFEIALANKGLGPAEMNGFKLRWKDQSDVSQSEMIDTITRLLTPEFDYAIHKFKDKTVMAVSERIIILSFRHNGSSNINSTSRHVFHDRKGIIQRDFGIYGRYQSILENSEKLKNRESFILDFNPCHE